MSKYASDQYLKHVLVKFCGTLDDNIPQPDSSLLNENQVKYWEDKIDNANSRKNNTHHMLKILKEYVKNDGVLSTEIKTNLFK